MNNRHFYHSLVIFFVGFAAMAQQPMTASEKKQFQYQVKQVAQKTVSLQSTFEQIKNLSMLKAESRATGILYFKDPDNIRWEYITPERNIAIFRENRLLVASEENRDEIDLDSHKLFRSLNDLIVQSIKGEMFDETVFAISYFKGDKENQVRFEPKDRKINRYMSAFILHFSKEKGTVTQVHLIEPNGDSTWIRFSKMQRNLPLDDMIFNLE